MMMTLKSLGALALGLATTAMAQCTREELVAITDSLLEAQSEERGYNERGW